MNRTMILMPGMICFLVLVVAAMDPDPCNMAYTLVDDGWRSSNCKMEFFGCDRYMSDGWYRVQDKDSQNYLQMPTSCVPSGRCGVVYPIWLNGSHPSIQDGVVNSTACVGSFRTCCHHSYPVRIKNCTDYMVYYLERAKGCMERYCFGDSVTCNTTDNINASDSTMTSTTIPKTTETRTLGTSTPNLVETSAFPESVTEIETTSHTTQNGESSPRTVQVSNPTTLNTTPRPVIRTMDTTPNLVESFSDAESVTTVVLNPDRSLTGITTTTHTSLNGGQIKGRPIETVRESDPELLIVIVVLSTFLVVLTAAVIIFIITQIRARNLYGSWIRNESKA